MLISHRQADLINTLKQKNLPNVVWFFNDDRNSVKKYDANRNCVVFFNGEQPVMLKANDRLIIRPGNLAIIVDGDMEDSANEHEFFIGTKKAGRFRHAGIIGDAVYQENMSADSLKTISPLDYIIHFDSTSGIVRAVEYPVTIPRDAMAKRADLKDRVLPKAHRQAETVKISDLVKGFDEGRMVKYMPHHANGDLNHPDNQIGKISSWNSRFVFVNFGNGDTSPACDPNDLVWMWSSGTERTKPEEDYQHTMGTLSREKEFKSSFV